MSGRELYLLTANQRKRDYNFWRTNERCAYIIHKKKKITIITVRLTVFLFNSIPIVWYGYLKFKLLTSSLIYVQP